tara:strand:- start:254 stop:721 length:468 start_codon:yes stop_codon:yes gene_type:complete
MIATVQSMRTYSVRVIAIVQWATKPANRAAGASAMPPHRLKKSVMMVSIMTATETLMKIASAELANLRAVRPISAFASEVAQNVGKMDAGGHAWTQEASRQRCREKSTNCVMGLMTTAMALWMTSYPARVVDQILAHASEVHKPAPMASSHVKVK